MRIILGDKNQILETAMNDYARLIFTICYSMTGDRFEAEDLAQEAFVSAYQHLGEFDGNNMKAWLTRIATNKCKDYLKSAARRIRPAESEVFAVIKDEEPLPEEALLQQDVEDKILFLCGSLKEPYQTISKEYFCKNKTAQMISEETGKNVKTIQTQIYRSKAMLKRLWEEEYK